MTKRLSVIAAVAALLPVSAVADAQTQAQTETKLDIQEWDVPWENTRPRDPSVASDTVVWFVGQRGNYMGRLDVTTGEFTRVELPDGAGPHNVIVDDVGMLWYAGNRDAHIGRYDPEVGEMERIDTPTPLARDPHTLVADGQDYIWFTAQGGNGVGRLTIDGRSVDMIEVPTSGARPYGIKLAPDGTPWVALFGTNKLASVDPATMTLTEHELPRDDARPRRLVISSDGRIWYGDYAGGMLGAYDPASGTFEEWQLPSGDNARPYGMAIDSEDRVWVVETGPSPNMFVGFDTDTEAFFASAAVPSGGGTVRHMEYHEPTGTIWFGADTNTVGRAKVQ